MVSLLEQFGIHLPDALTNAPFTKGAGHFEIVRTGAIINLPAVLDHRGDHLPLLRRHPPVGALQLPIVVAIKVAVIILFIGFGMWVIDGANWHPFIPPNTGEFGQFGWSGVVPGGRHHLLRLHRLRRGLDRGAGSEEPAARHADRHPRAASRSARSSTSCVSAVLTGMVHYSQLDTAGTRRGGARPASRSSRGSRAGSSSARSPA